MPRHVHPGLRREVHLLGQRVRVVEGVGDEHVTDRAAAAELDALDAVEPGRFLARVGTAARFGARVRGLHAPDEAVRVEHEDVPLARGRFVHEVDRAAAQGGRGRPRWIRPRRFALVQVGARQPDRGATDGEPRRGGALGGRVGAEAVNVHGVEPFGVQLDLRVHVAPGQTQRGLADLRHSDKVRSRDVAGDEHHLATEAAVDHGRDLALARGVGHLVEAAQLEYVDEFGRVVHGGRAPPGSPDRHHGCVS
mmetsp:Transcript_2432/g.10451  ORF Transcript_2432/g.10451 Transcript_2432/m.10451 type:complete len:251 (+) Transcript_2432:5493-6245(+)